MAKKDYNFNDLIQINTNKEKFFGILMPSVNQDTLVLKLDSGYNIGIKKNKIKKIILLKKFMHEKTEKQDALIAMK